MRACFIPYEVNEGVFNMDFDEKILDYSIENQLEFPILRFYGWAPACVSLGRNQKNFSLNESFCKKNNIGVVRRLTGGRALLHENEVTYSFVCPVSFLNNGASVIQSYKEISGALALGLKKLGIFTEFPNEKRVETNFDYCMSLATGADLSFNGRKIVGSAQFRKQNYILQHGSILLDYDTAKIEEIFDEKIQTEKIATMKEIDPLISKFMLVDALKKGMGEFFDLAFNEEIVFPV